MGNINCGIESYNSSGSLSFEYGICINNQGGNILGPLTPYGFGILVATNANGDSCDSYNNIFLNPMFVDPSNGDYNLRCYSPCIDAGDPESPLDPDSTIADIGAFYFDQSGEIRCMTAAISGDNIVLDWMDKPFATVYHIYRSTQPYFDITGINPIANTTSPEYLDYGALSGGVYYYRVTWE